jgi:molybdopterin synthase catalytic subunit
MQAAAELDLQVRVQRDDFDAGREIAELRRGNPKIGAVASFIGLMRDINDGAAVSGMTLEHYAGMTEKSIRAIVAQAQGRWNIIGVRVIHRIGRLEPTDQIVFVAVASSHRGDAFAACQFIMDYLKTRAPFWKKEETAHGDRWVDARATDDVAAERWRLKG